MAMSQKIEDVLQVLAGIRGGYQPDKLGAVRRVRIRVVHQIAKQRGIECQTISDAYIRGLAPDIERTPEFDRLVEEWLASGSKRLQQILQNHALDRSDLVRISEFFLTTA